METKPTKNNQTIKWTIIISLIILIIFLGISYDSFAPTSTTTGYSFVAQAYKIPEKIKEIDRASIKNLKQTSPYCKETDNIGIVPTGFQPFIFGKITFQELIKQTQGINKKSSSEFITSTLSDNCKDFQYLIEYNCDNYNPKSLYKISEKLYSVVKCDYGCNQQFGKCNTQPSCDNKVKDGDELVVDCGGKICKPCQNQQFCEDSDGSNYENKGFAVVELNNNGKKEKTPIDDYCKENILYEQECAINGYKEEQYDCAANGYKKCEDGKCVEKANCIDSDDGDNIYIPGAVKAWDIKSPEDIIFNQDYCYGEKNPYNVFGSIVQQVSCNEKTEDPLVVCINKEVCITKDPCNNNNNNNNELCATDIICFSGDKDCYYAGACKSKQDLFCYKSNIPQKEYYLENSSCSYKEEETDDGKTTIEECQEIYFIISDGTFDKLYKVKILNWPLKTNTIQLQFIFNVLKTETQFNGDIKYIDQEIKSFPFIDGKETIFEYEGIKFTLLIDTQKKFIFFKDLGEYPPELQNIQCS
ncbi:hypothetical protein HZA96_01260 [Candidatus Woesearchaeota archaeon]|nr:hypothetical protein [Candidatus Woesearchaeota archaeon]